LKYCEDAALWDIMSSSGSLKERRVIVTCDPGRKAWNTVMGPLANPNPHGGLWIYTPGKKSAELHRLVLKNYPKGHDFHPLGLDIYPSYGGNASNLFVINHARERSTIEHFTIFPSDPSQATWVNTLVSNYLVSPNSLALTSPTSFYVSNDHLITRRIPTYLSRVLPMVETLLGSPSSWVSHISLDHHGGSPRIQHAFAALGIAFANGVALSPDGKQVALASSSVGEIYFYSRSPTNNTLKHTHTVPMPFSPDNIRFDDEGALLITGHPVSTFPLPLMFSPLNYVLSNAALPVSNGRSREQDRVRTQLGTIHLTPHRPQSWLPCDIPAVALRSSGTGISE
jgi:hypothetical protein